MGKVSAIEWTDATWNPWMGCTKVSEGCTNCYAEREMKRFGRDFNIVTRSKTTFQDPLKWEEPRTILTCSWGDFFHKGVPKKWRNDAWKIMRRTPRHTYLILTKRPGVALSSMPNDWQMNWDKEFSHVWLGVSVEKQATLHRVITISKIPTTHLFVSAEPLLGRIKFSFYMDLIDWIITGGESGPDPRPCNLDWVRRIRDECLKNKVAFFHKQNGGSKKVDGAWGGRTLDGQIWEEFPKSRRDS